MRRLTAAVLILLLALGLTACGGGDERKSEGITNTYVLEEPFTDISIETTCLDVEIVPSKDGTSTVTCQEAPELLHEVYVEDGTLIVKRKDEKSGGNFTNIPLKIEVSIPAGEYGNLTVKTSSGGQNIQSAFIFSNADLTASSGGIGCDAIVKGGIWIITSSGAQMIRGAVAATIHAESSSGSIYAEELVAGTDYSFETSSGSICLTNVICGGTLKAESTSGDVLLDGCDAGHVIIETSSGNVKGSLRTGKQFKVKTGSGSVSVPADAAGGQCEIRTTSGNVSITVG